MIVKPPLKCRRLGETEERRGRNRESHFGHAKFEVVPPGIQMHVSGGRLQIKFDAEKFNWQEMIPDGFSSLERTRTSKKKNINI